MTLLIRSLQTMIRGLLGSRIHSIDQILIDKFRVLPFDIDVYRHMNNAKYLNYMEAARWGLMVKSGFFKISLQKGWIGPLAGVAIEYYRPLTLGKKFELSTQFVRFDERWFYILQRFHCEGKEMARALVKGTVRKGRENIPPNVYLQAIGFNPQELSLEAELSDWLNRYCH